jgi:hypothetical protein
MSETRHLLLRHKYFRIIDLLPQRTGLSLRCALDLFYRSETYAEMVEGISDMHCRSDAYLAEELRQEYDSKTA